jgi:hypothetical protein
MSSDDGSVWIYKKHPVALPTESTFGVNLNFGGTADRPTPTEQFVAGLTCATCGEIHGSCLGHVFQEPEDVKVEEKVSSRYETMKVVLLGHYTTKIETDC